jgi:EF hand
VLASWRRVRAGVTFLADVWEFFMFPRKVLSFIVLLVACDGASAQDRPQWDDLLQADANKDGSISRAEYLDARSQQFGKLDRNSDGYLDDADLPTRSEGQPQRGRRLAQLRTQLDSNSDAKVSKAEFVDAPAPAFERADTDPNDVLGPEEIEAVRSKVRKRPGRARADDGA